VTQRVLCVVAHPDDEMLGVGGTLVRHADAGDYVTILILADCESARSADVRPELKPATHNAAALLIGPGISTDQLEFGGFRGLTLREQIRAVTERVEGVARRVKPDVVYTHFAGDLNSDHRAACEATVVATRPIGAHAPLRLLSFETPSSTEWTTSARFSPSSFVGIDIERKLAAMACYGAELREPPHPRNLEMLRARAVFWGQHAGLEHAEAFVLLREVAR